MQKLACFKGAVFGRRPEGRGAIASVDYFRNQACSGMFLQSDLQSVDEFGGESGEEDVAVVYA